MYMYIVTGKLEIVLTALYEHGCRAIFSNAVYAVLFTPININYFAPKKVKFKLLWKILNQKF